MKDLIDIFGSAKIDIGDVVALKVRKSITGTPRPSSPGFVSTNTAVTFFSSNSTPICLSGVEP